MQLSQTTEYAVRAVLSIAARHPEPMNSAELAAELALPANYLAKTLSQLVRAGLLQSSRGATGGFRLSRSPDEIRLGDVVHPFAARTHRRCLLGLGACGENPTCPVHQRWMPSARSIDAFFETTTIADLLVPVELDTTPAARAGALSPSPTDT